MNNENFRTFHYSERNSSFSNGGFSPVAVNAAVGPPNPAAVPDVIASGDVSEGTPNPTAVPDVIAPGDVSVGIPNPAALEADH